MIAFRIWTFPRWAAYDLASMLLALLVLIADFLALDVGSLVKKYPDLSQDQLLCLLNMRGDLVRFFFFLSLLIL